MSKKSPQVQEIQDAVTEEVKSWSDPIYLWPVLILLVTLATFAMGITTVSLGNSIPASYWETWRYTVSYNDTVDYNTGTLHRTVTEYKVPTSTKSYVANYMYLTHALIFFGGLVLLGAEGYMGRFPCCHRPEQDGSRQGTTAAIAVEPHLFVNATRAVIWCFIFSSQMYEKGYRSDWGRFCTIMLALALSFFVYCNDALTYMNYNGRADGRMMDTKIFTVASAIIPLAIISTICYYIGISWTDYSTKNGVAISSGTGAGAATAAEVYTNDVMLMFDLISVAIMVFVKSIRNVFDMFSFCWGNTSVSSENGFLTRRGSKKFEDKGWCTVGEYGFVANVAFMASYCYEVGFYLFYAYVLLLRTNYFNMGAL